MQRASFTIVLACVLLLGLQPASAFDLTVTITSQPVRSGQVGAPYVYDVDAVSSDSSATITYTLKGNPPSGMSIDAATGLIEWMPASVGSFGIRVRVKARLDGSAATGLEAEAEQEYSLLITTTGGAATASLQGTVLDPAGSGVRRVEIKMFDGTGRLRLFETRTDSTGSYRIGGVVPGTYFVKADPPEMSNFEDQWFDNVRRFEQATPVLVAESAHAVINFVLSPRDSDDASFDVSGFVLGPDGAALANARVMFNRTDDDDSGNHDLERRGGDDHGHHGHHGNETQVVYSDSLGAYHLRLRAHTYSVSAWKEGYRRQWWNHQSSASAADRLMLARDTTGIDFDLTAISLAASVQGSSVKLRQNYPNPFNPTTSIGFTLPSSGKVRLTVYNMLGQSIATLVDGELSAGDHRVDWRAGDAASGLYFYRVEFGGTAEVRRMTLVR
jgi:hypothetical protein